MDHHHQSSSLHQMTRTYSLCHPMTPSYIKRNNQRTCQAYTTELVNHNKTNYMRKIITSKHIYSKGDKPNIANTVFCSAAITGNKIKTIYIHLAGKFPFFSYEGNEYLFVVYDYNSTAIIFCPIPNREACTCQLIPICLQHA